MADELVLCVIGKILCLVVSIGMSYQIAIGVVLIPIGIAHRVKHQNLIFIVIIAENGNLPLR